MGIYAALGVCLTIAFFTSGAAIGLLTQSASKALHRWAITSVMRAPMSFFETTPLGRIMNRFSKDIDTIDNTVSDSLRMFLMTFSNVIGAFVLIGVIIPWFLIAVAALMVVYYFLSIYYRASARELKRLDAILRSSLYAHFSESLTGLATIRAYGETDRFRKESEDRMNIENRSVCISNKSRKRY
jgi:ABC-type multidrug transport system fused ATPase/permease subunit